MKANKKLPQIIVRLHEYFSGKREKVSFFWDMLKKYCMYLREKK